MLKFIITCLYLNKGCIFEYQTKANIMKIKMTLISKGIKVEKIVTSDYQVYIFKRDMPAKYNLLFSGKPYIIGQTNL